MYVPLCLSQLTLLVPGETCSFISSMFCLVSLHSDTELASRFGGMTTVGVSGVLEVACTCIAA